jgi:glucose-6-phosphate 1-dehydrogenase
MELKDNTIIVVLGASGDLAKKKTVGTRRRVSLAHQLTHA